MRRVPVEEARKLLGAAVVRFFAEAAQRSRARTGGERITPPVDAVRVSLGVGKSSEARRDAADMLSTMRQAGDRTARRGDEQQ